MLDLIEHGPIREIRLARPPVNALDPELVGRLQGALRQAGNEAEAVVLSGAEGLFCAGLDVPALLPLDRAAMQDFWSGFVALMTTIGRMPVPTVAAITGHSPAGGAVMALFCDYRVMSRGPFKIGLNETRVGLSLPDFIHGALVRLVGPHRAERLIVSGALLAPEEALEVGLVDDLAEDPQTTVATARQWCEELLQLPPNALRNNRRTMRASLTALFEADPEQNHEAFLGVWFSDETQATLRQLVASLKKK